MSYIAHAEEIAKRYNTRDPFKIAKEAGIYVLYLQFNKQIYGVACSLGEYKFIGVNWGLDESAQKLVVAHELGHFILHPDENFFFISNYTLLHGKFEYQANLFAVGLCAGAQIANQEMVKGLAAGRDEKLFELFDKCQ